ncbi:MAG: GNAT family N-acetyltransferase [Pseudomonadota bacterium]
MITSLDIPPIATKRLMLRGFVTTDYPAYCAYYRSDRTIGVGGPRPEHEIFERFCSMIGHWHMRGFGRYAIAPKTGGRAFGHVGPLKLTDAPIEMTWTLWDPARLGQGYAIEATRAVLEDCFAKGWDTLLAVIDRDNTASLRLAEKLGAEPLPGDTPNPADPKLRRFVLRKAAAA